MKQETIRVTGMSCAHCEARLEKTLSALPGVKSCAADARRGEVRVAYELSLIHISWVLGAILTAVCYRWGNWRNKGITKETADIAAETDSCLAPEE